MKQIVRIYLFLLASLIGAEIAIGVFLAPVIFFPQAYIGDGVLSHYQSGKLMTQVFLKYNVFLIAISVLCFIYETINSWKNAAETFRVKFSALALATICLILGGAFAFYFTNYIVTAQNLGELATQTKPFLSVHSASETTMKIMLLAQAWLFFLRINKI